MSKLIRLVVWELQDNGQWSICRIREFVPRTRADGKFDALTQRIMTEAMSLGANTRVELLDLTAAPYGS